MCPKAHVRPRILHIAATQSPTPSWARVELNKCGTCGLYHGNMLEMRFNALIMEVYSRYHDVIVEHVSKSGLLKREVNAANERLNSYFLPLVAIIYL